MHYASNVTPSTKFYTLSLHDALPISDFARNRAPGVLRRARDVGNATVHRRSRRDDVRRQRRRHRRSEEHTSELQSQFHLVCRLLLEKKNKKINYAIPLAWVLQPVSTF